MKNEVPRLLQEYIERLEKALTETNQVMLDSTCSEYQLRQFAEIASRNEAIIRKGAI